MTMRSKGRQQQQQDTIPRPLAVRLEQDAQSLYSSFVLFPNKQTNTQ